ncbi:MAG: 30S ribosomal protein S21 [Patescibacteria group bacterium]|jgi:ribosomal protein S21
MSEVKRKKGESFEALLRRFNKTTIRSGRILQAKKIQFYRKPKNKSARKTSALRSKELREKREYLRKIGKLPEEYQR